MMRKIGKSWLGTVLAGLLMTGAGCAVERDTEMEDCGGRERCSADAMPAAEVSRSVPAPARAAKARSNGASERNFTSSGERKMTYRTNLVLQCQDVPGAVRSAGEIARKHHGYVVESDNRSIRLKVPVEEADAALAELEALGKVAERKIAAQDVTEQYVDTQVRLDNLQKLQNKLTELLKRAEAVDDALKIERELARVTTELERYQAMMKNLALQVAMVDMQIRFNAVLPPAAPGPMIPIPWVAKLGTEISRKDFPLNQDDDVPFKVSIPAGFAVLFSNDEMLYAVNPDDVVLKLSRRMNFRDADLPFYQSLMERSLFNQNGYRKIHSERIRPGRYPVAAVAGERMTNRAPVMYEAMLMIYDHGWFGRDEVVYLVELWGKADAVKAVDRESLLKSVRF